MTHIIELDEQDFTKTCDDRCALILKPVRTVSVNDKVIFEHNNQQQERIVESVSDRPGLMKGYSLYIFKTLD